MSFNTNKKRFAILNDYKKQWRAIEPRLSDISGIYVIGRTDEYGVNYAYVGQSVHILRRLAEHCIGFQMVDLSIKKRKLFSKDNVFGWRVLEFYPTTDLDGEEKKKIIEYMLKGYQLRYNRTLGGQNSKESFDNTTSGKGYHEGVKYGYLKAIKDIKLYFDKYLDFSIKPKSNKTKERKFEEFKELMKEDVKGSKED